MPKALQRSTSKNNAYSISTTRKIFRNLDISEKTVAVYSTFIRQYGDYLTETGKNEDASSIKSFLLQIKGSPATINLALNAIRRYLTAKYSHDTRMLVGLVQLFRSPELKKRKTALEKCVKETDYLTREQVFTMAKKCRNSNPRLSLILQALFWTGARISELLGITLDRVVLDTVANIKITGKGRKERTVFIPFDLYKTIVQECGSLEYLFETRAHKPLHRVNVSKSISRLGKKHGYQIHAHTLRHSCAMYLKDDRGLSADKISKYLGHSSPAITLQYYFHGGATAEDIGLL